MDHDHAQAALNWIGNVASLGAIITTLLGILPAIGAVIAIIWYTLQIYESETFQKWLRERRARKIAWLELQLRLARKQHAEDPKSTPND